MITRNDDLRTGAAAASVGRTLCGAFMARRVVSGIWYLVYCTGPIAYPIVNGYSPSGTWGPRTSTCGPELSEQGVVCDGQNAQRIIVSPFLRSFLVP